MLESRISSVESKKISRLFEQQNSSGISHVDFTARNSLGLRSELTPPPHFGLVFTGIFLI